MQRLFSMFPRGRAGVALLLLRLALAATIWPTWQGARAQTAALDSVAFTFASGTSALALCLGLLTPLVATACIALKLLACLWWEPAATLAQACTIVHAAALSLLGPGGYSIDATLFGRKQIIVVPPDRRGRH